MKGKIYVLICYFFKVIKVIKCYPSAKKIVPDSDSKQQQNVIRCNALIKP